MSILDTGGQDGSRGGALLILVFSTALAGAWATIALLALLG